MVVTTEYLSGGRIQGRSDDTSDATPDYTQLYENSSDSNISITGGSTYFNVDSTVADALYLDPRRSSNNYAQTWDLGSTLSETAWVVRFKVNITSVDNSGATCRVFWGMSNKTSSDGAMASHNFIGMASYTNSSQSQWYRLSTKGNNLDVGEANQYALATGTLYIELIRKTETTYSVRWTTNSDYTGGTIENETVGDNGGGNSTSSMNLRYFWVSNVNVSGNSDCHIQGNIEDVKIWNGVTTTTTAKDKSSITNVPVGTRYEETDTRKIFRRKGSAVSLTGLKAYFPMNEASGKLINKASDYGSTDAISNFDLTVTGGTQNTSGKIDKCVSFSGNQKAEAADSNASDTAFLSNNGAAWTICFWSKVEGLASGGNIEGDQAWFSTTGYAVGENGVMCRVAATVAPPNNPAYTNMQIGTLSDDRVNGTTSANGLESGGAGSGTGWHFIVLQYDDSTGIARQSKDNGAWNNAATGGNLTNTDTPSDKFRIGQMDNNNNNLNGDMEAFSIWNRVLTANEITTLYGNTTDVGQGLAPSWVEKGVA